jgi:basic amino acid/polyamine antiporter, APA family
METISNKASGVSTLKRKINLFDAAAIVIGSMIGSGIFIVSSDIARQLGSPGWLLVVWVISGLLTLAAAISYGQLASVFPDAGGQYIYLQKTYNPLIGFLFGWAFFLVMQGGSIAAVGMAFGKFLGVVFPWFSDGHILLDLGFVKLNTVHLAAIASIIFLSWVNSLGVQAGKLVQNLFTIIKVGILVLFIIAGIIYARNIEAIQANWQGFWEASKSDNGQSTPLFGWALVIAITTSTVGALFSLDAWNNITFAAGEVKNPKTTVSRSLVIGVLVVAVLYVFTNMVYLMALPLHGSPDGASSFARGIQFASNDRIGTASIEVILGSYAAIVMAIFVVISTFGCNNGMILSGARVYYAMAQDKLFFKSAGQLNKHKVPARALTLQCIWSILLCMSGSYSNLLDFVIATVLLFYVLTIGGVFIMRFKTPKNERQDWKNGFFMIPLSYMIITLFITVILLLYKPEYTWPGMLIIVLGIPVYYLWRRFAKYA